MANTSALKVITDYAIKKISSDLNVELIPGQVSVGNHGVMKKFNGISSDRDIVVRVLNHSGYTSGGKLPTGKIKSTFADCYLLSLTKAKTKILAVTNKEFFDIFRKASDGLLDNIQLRYIDLPDNLKAIAQEVVLNASAEMS